MNILAIDVGGTHVKILANGAKEKREIKSGPTMTAQQMLPYQKRTYEDYAGLRELEEFGPGESTSKKWSNVWW